MMMPRKIAKDMTDSMSVPVAQASGRVSHSGHMPAKQNMSKTSNAIMSSEYQAGR